MYFSKKIIDYLYQIDVLTKKTCVSETGVDEMGSRRSGMTPSTCHVHVVIHSPVIQYYTYKSETPNHHKPPQNTPETTATTLNIIVLHAFNVMAIC